MHDVAIERFKNGEQYIVTSNILEQEEVGYEPDHNGFMKYPLPESIVKEIRYWISKGYSVLPDMPKGKTQTNIDFQAIRRLTQQEIDNLGGANKYAFPVAAWEIELLLNNSIKDSGKYKYLVMWNFGNKIVFTSYGEKVTIFNDPSATMKEFFQ